MKRTLLGIVIFTCALCAAVSAFAQDSFPSKPIRFIVPFPPAGGADIVARDLAAQLAGNLKSQVVVENRPGAGAQINDPIRLGEGHGGGRLVEHLVVPGQEPADRLVVGPDFEPEVLLD